MRSPLQASLVPKVIDLIGIGFDTKFAPQISMANVIIRQTLKNGDCSPQDLRTFGFDEKEIAERWHMADAMASIELKLMANKTISKPTCEVRYA
jgi:hypothetical protein